MSRTVGLRWQVVCVFVAVALQATSAWGQPDASLRDGELPWLFKLETQDLPPLPEDERFANALVVDVQRESLTDRQVERFRMRLPGSDEPVTVVQDRVERHSDGFVWFGRIEDEPGSHVILSVVEEAVAGSIRSPDRPTFSIEPIADLQFLRQIDFRRNIPEAGSLKTPPTITLTPKGCGDPASEIDVMVLYTEEARTLGVSDPRTFSTAGMEAEIYRFVAETNQASLDSDVDARLRLVHIQQVKGVPDDDPVDTTATPLEVRHSQDIDVDLPALVSNTAVQDLRDLHGADLVVLLVHQEEKSRSAGPEPKASSTTDHAAYSIVIMSYAEDTLTFSHEIGHLFGADHNCDSDEPPPDATAEYHGFDPGGGLKTTLMATTGERLLRWSDPNALHPDDSTVKLGSADPACPADNHAVINAAAKYVANYRCSSPGRDDVWMKDTWFDTGEEPSMGTFFDPIWDSPYLWIRRDRDPDLLHQHEHENPVAGQHEFVYVKLQNGSNQTQQGELEVWWGDSTTDADWPGDWNLIHSTHVTSFAPHSVRIVETDWDPVPPASDSVCLVARWISDDDPLSVPAEDRIWPHVANNNNVIWKNLVIVPLFSTLSPSVVRSFELSTDRLPPELGHLDVEPRHVSLHIPPPPPPEQRWFVRDGRVLIRFNAELMEAWRRSDDDGEGYRLGEEAFLLTPDRRGSVIEFDLPRGVEGRVEVTFERLPTTPRRDYELHIEQRIDGQPVGGMSYAIRCATPPPDRPVSEPSAPASGGPGG